MKVSLAGHLCETNQHQCTWEGVPETGDYLSAIVLVRMTGSLNPATSLHEKVIVASDVYEEIYGPVAPFPYPLSTNRRRGWG